MTTQAPLGGLHGSGFLWRILKGRRGKSASSRGTRSRVKARLRGAWQLGLHDPLASSHKADSQNLRDAGPGATVRACRTTGRDGGGISWSRPGRVRASIAVTPYLLDSSSPTIAGSAQYFSLVAPAQAAELQAFLINGLKGLSSLAEASISASVSSTEIIFPNFLQRFHSPSDSSLPTC